MLILNKEDIYELHHDQDQKARQGEVKVGGKTGIVQGRTRRFITQKKEHRGSRGIVRTEKEEVQEREVYRGNRPRKGVP